MREELELFAHNLNVFMDTYGYTQTRLAEEVGVSVPTVHDWCHAKKSPRWGKIDIMCKLFHCKRSDLVEKYTTEETIKQSEMENRLATYLQKLNPDGYENLLRYLEDMNPKFFKDGDEDVQ